MLICSKMIHHGLTNQAIQLIGSRASNNTLVRMSMTSRRMRNLLAPILIQRMFNRVKTFRRVNTPGKRRAIQRLTNMGVGHRNVMGPMRMINSLSEYLTKLRRVPGTTNMYRVPNNPRVVYRLNRNGNLTTTSSIGRAPIRGVQSGHLRSRISLKM